MSRRWRTGVAGACWLVAACAPAPRPAAEAAPTPTPRVETEGDGITLERGPCFGTCPVYTVTLSRSGAVRFEGRRFVADSGGSTGAARASEWTASSPSWSRPAISGSPTAIEAVMPSARATRPTCRR